MSNAHTIYEATTRQIAGLELEREAHLQQIKALVDERDALRAERDQAIEDRGRMGDLLVKFAAERDEKSRIIGLLRAEIDGLKASLDGMRMQL